MATKLRICSIFDRDMDVGIDCSGESLTKQSEKDSCDINLILARYRKTGVLPDLIRADARYGDFSSVPALQEAFEIVAHATSQFEALDAQVRERFHHDPVEMLEFVNNPATKREQLVELGLAVPPSQHVPATDGGAASSSKTG